MPFNFKEMLSQAAFVDNRLAHLKSKVMMPSSLGLGRNAMSTLKELTADVQSIVEPLNEKGNIEEINDYISYLLSSFTEMLSQLKQLESQVDSPSYKPFSEDIDKNDSGMSPLIKEENNYIVVDDETISTIANDSPTFLTPELKRNALSEFTPGMFSYHSTSIITPKSSQSSQQPNQCRSKVIVSLFKN